MKMIAATDEEGGIGKDGGIPWYYTEDLRFLKFMTLHKNIVMGRKTFENIGKLPDRKMYILSKEKSGYIGDDKKVKYVTVEELFLGAFNSEREVFNCGGGEIYNLFLDRVDEAFITRVDGTYDCDTFLPDVSERLTKVYELPLTEELTVERWIESKKLL